MGELTQLQPLRREHLTDFGERRFAEILTRQQFLFGATRQIAERKPDTQLARNGHIRRQEVRQSERHNRPMLAGIDLAVKIW